jgi:hypothetical protein
MICLPLRSDGIARIAMALVVVLVGTIGCVGEASADADDRSLSTELRVGVFAPSYRWSNGLADAARLVNYAEKSLYFNYSLGARFYSRAGHGALVEFDYRQDTDLDSACYVFCEDDPPTFRIDFALARAGYAYRYVVPGAKEPKRRAWAFTPHISVTAGGAISEREIVGIPRWSPVVGGRVGFDIDWHISRFFMGWGLRYEVLAHTRGSLRYSQFFDWNAIPVFRIGGVIGRAAVEEPRRRR